MASRKLPIYKINPTIKNQKLMSKLKVPVANASVRDKLRNDISEQKSPFSYKPVAQNSSCHIKVDPANIVTLGSGIFNSKMMAEADERGDFDK